MDFEDHFSEQARGYSEHRPTYPPALFHFLASISPGRQLAWDCGTGNGQAALLLAAHFQHVIASDASQEQIRNAFPDERVSYRVETAENSSIPENAVNLTTAGTAAHWFDFDRFYPEVRRVSVPGAVLAVWTYHLPEIHPEVDGCLERLYRRTLEGYWPEKIRYLENRYRNLPFPFEEMDHPPFRMEAEWRLDQLVGFINSWSATQKFLEAEEEHPLENMWGELQHTWGENEKKRLVTWPMHIRLGRVPG